MKRLLDVALSAIALLVLSPLMLLAAAGVRIALGSPVIFRHLRPGLNGELFTLMKFRTMRDARDANGDLQSDAERLTAFGRFLRRTSLDELPELINVLKGDMSLVGPRPLLPEYLPLYSSEQRRRHDVRPGLTGWAQINGRNTATWAQKFSCDVWYVDNQSVLLDLKILAATIRMVLTGEGVSEPGEATAAPFRGDSSGAPEHLQR